MAVEHKITHYYQPTNHTCSQASMAMLRSFFGDVLTPEEVMQEIGVNKNEAGEEWGTINQQLATWCLSQGFDVELHTADFQIIDLSWANLQKEKMLERMELCKTVRFVPSLGKDFSQIYMQSYIDFVKAGGQLYIHPFMTSALLDELLCTSPLLASVAMSVLYNDGRSRNIDPRGSVPDDLHGSVVNHSVVIYGKSDEGKYLVADPWEEPGRHEVETERLLAAMTAAQVECDNLFFQLRRKS